MAMQIISPWVTVPEAAKYLRVRAETVRLLANAGYIHMRRLSDVVPGLPTRTTGLINVHELDALMESGKGNPALELVARERVMAHE